MAAAANKDDEKKGGKALAELRGKNADIVFIIARSKNQNIVVYEALRDKEKKKLAAEKPIDVYWLDIDPAYIAANRKKGIMTDRSELNMVEQSMAYGLKYEEYKEKGAGHYKVTLVAVPERPIDLYIDDKGVAIAAMTIDGKVAIIQRIYVSSVERMLGLLPKVEYIELFGVTHEGVAVTEKILPK